MDEELPAGYQDADLEMAALQNTASHENRLNREGICCHGRVYCSRDFGFGEATCADCGQKFESMQALLEDRKEKLS